MIDMHSHLLFGVDDGPETMEETLTLLEKADKEGITDMIATPHAFSPHYHVPKEIIEIQLERIRNATKDAGISVELHSGQEIRLHDEIIENIHSKEAMTLAGSRYVLLELPSQSIPNYTVNIIQTMLGEGIIPIIAHPERNRAIAEKPERLERLVRHGALAQITAGSLAGKFGKNIQKSSLQLIEANLIHTYGSDVHNLKTRPFYFNEGLDYLERRMGLDIVDILLGNNERIIKNKPLFIMEPDIPKQKKWWQFVGI